MASHCRRALREDEICDLFEDEIMQNPHQVLTDTEGESSDSESEGLLSVGNASSSQNMKPTCRLPDIVGDSSESSRKNNVLLANVRGSNSPQIPVWKTKEIVTTVPIFNMQEGAVKTIFIDCKCPTDYFCKFFDEELINSIVYQSNLYVVQSNHHFAPFQASELYGFLGLTLLFGYHRLPAIRDYWSSARDLGVDLVKETMTRDRYKAILANLHVSDNLSMPVNNTDKLFKIRPMINHLNGVFQKCKLPPQWMSIDESMVLFKGRSSIKQYNPMKPIKRGYKLWCRSDCSGYTYEFDVYQGKAGDKSDANKENFGLGPSIVLRLTQSLKGKNHIVVFDNYFTSVELMQTLLPSHIYACGTVRKTRKGLIPLKADKDLKRGDFDFRSRPGTNICEVDGQSSSALSVKLSRHRASVGKKNTKKW